MPGRDRGSLRRFGAGHKYFGKRQKYLLIISERRPHDEFLRSAVALLEERFGTHHRRYKLISPKPWRLSPLGRPSCLGQANVQRTEEHSVLPNWPDVEGEPQVCLWPIPGVNQHA